MQMKLTQFKTNLDRGATYLFPLMFCIFNLSYWSYYLWRTSLGAKHKISINLTVKAWTTLLWIYFQQHFVSSVER